MIKKNLFKNLILVTSIISSVVMVGCATNNVATNDTGVSVEVVDASDVTSDVAEMAPEDVAETDVVAADNTDVATDEETVKTDSETSGEGDVASSEKTEKVDKEDKAVSGSTNTGSTPKTTGTTETVKPSVNEGKVADNKTAGNKTGGTVTSSKPSGIPTSVPNNGKTTKPVEIAKNENGNTNSVQAKPSINSSSTFNGVSNGTSDGSDRTYTRTDRYGNVQTYSSYDELLAASQKDHDDYVNGFTATVTVNNGVTDAMNKYREENGKAAVSSNDYLDEKAKTRAEEIAKDFTHNSASGLTGQENIQANYGGGATNEQVVENYSESYGHNGTMLDDYQSASSATATVTDVDGNVVAQYDVTVFDDHGEIERIETPDDWDPSLMD